MCTNGSPLGSGFSRGNPYKNTAFPTMKGKVS